MSWKLFHRLCGKSLAGRRPRRPARFRPRLEQLEDRVVPATGAVTFTWTGQNSASWKDPGNWSGANGQVPGADPDLNDVLLFPAAGVTNPTSINDIPGTVSVSQIQIPADAISISGNPITLATNQPAIPVLDASGVAHNNKLTSNITLAQDSRLNINNFGDFTLGGVVSGSFGFHKFGNGTLILTAANTYTGATDVADGILEIQNPQALGTTGSPTSVNSLNDFAGELRLGPGSTGGLEPLILTGQGAFDEGALSTFDNITWNGDITLGSPIVVVGVYGPQPDGTPTVLTLSDSIGDIGTLRELIKRGTTGTLVFDGHRSNTYTGQTTVEEGSLVLQKTPRIPGTIVNAVAGPLSIGDSIGAQGSDVVILMNNEQIADNQLVTVTVTGLLVTGLAVNPLPPGASAVTETVGGLTINGGEVRGTTSDTLKLAGNVTAASTFLAGTAPQPATIDGWSRLDLGSATRTFTVNDGPATFDLKVLNPVGGTTGVGLIKARPGIMRLFANNTYSGATIVNAGILQIDGNNSNSVTTVNSGGTVAGGGTAGTLTVNGGGGVRPFLGRTLTVSGAASFADSTTFFTTEQVGTFPFSRLVATGPVALNNGTLHVLDTTGSALSIPVTIVSGSAVTGTFNGLPDGTVLTSSGGNSYRVHYTGTSVTLTRTGPAFRDRAITSPINEGSVATLTGHIITVLPTDIFFLDVNWGDGRRQTFRFGPDAPRDVAVHHRYRDDGTYPVGLLWRDQRGSFNTDTLSVTVLNVAPAVDAGDDAQIFQGGMLTRLVTFIDPGHDKWTATVDFGDGSAPQAINVHGRKHFLLRHRYTEPGTFTVTVTVRDDDGGVGTASFQVQVLPGRHSRPANWAPFVYDLAFLDCSLT